jgi:hypothetical protein
MPHKQENRSRPARSRLSIASRMMGSTLRGTLPAFLPQEPSRNRKPEGKSRGKRSK